MKANEKAMVSSGLPSYTGSRRPRTSEIIKSASSPQSLKYLKAPEVCLDIWMGHFYQPKISDTSTQAGSAVSLDFQDDDTMPNGNLKVAVDLQVKHLGFSLQNKTAYSLSQPLEAGKPGRQAKKQLRHWGYPIPQSSAQPLPHTLLLYPLLINIYLMWCMGTGERG